MNGMVLDDAPLANWRVMRARGCSVMLGGSANIGSVLLVVGVSYRNTTGTSGAL